MSSLAKLSQSPKERNKRSCVEKFAIGSAIAYTTYRLARWAWKSVASKDRNESKFEQESVDARQLANGSQSSYVTTSCDSARLLLKRNTANWRLRRIRMAQCRDDTLKAIGGILPALRRVVEEETDTVRLRKKLKNLRAARDTPDYNNEEERKLWETFKVRAMTQMIATAYANTMLFLVLTVQVNQLGGKIFREHEMINTCKSCTNGSDWELSYKASHRLVLSHTYESFFEHGLLTLIRFVEDAVSKAAADWDVLAAASLHMTREEVDKMINKIRAIIEDSEQDSQCNSLLHFLMPPLNTTAAKADEIACSILDEAWDLIESPVFADAFRDSLHVTFDILKERFWGTLFESGTSPLALLLSKMQNSTQCFYEHQVNQTAFGIVAQNSTSLYCSTLETLPSLLELCDVSFN